VADEGQEDEATQASPHLQQPGGSLTEVAGGSRDGSQAGAAPSGSLTRIATTRGSSATTVGSPLEALEHDEILRTRWFCLIAAVIAVAGGLSTLVLPGDPLAARIMLVAVGIALGAVVFLYRRTFDPLAFRRWTTGFGWFIPAAAVTTAMPYFGVFSPAAVVLVLGIYFTGLGKSFRLSLAVYGTCAGVHGLTAILVLSGIRDTGIVQATSLAAVDKLIIQLLVQVVFVATFATARISRRTALAAVGELERAVRLAAHREALLLEAREELERALRQGRGRFSDQAIAGYQLGAVLGRGAMGEVYEAHGPRGRVAIKLLSQTSLGNPHHVMRFLRELQTAANLRSPHIVEVIEVGERPVPYLVMERLDGKTLSEILRAKKQLPGRDVIELIAQVGEGITAAGAAGIVHRDLKPQNLFRVQGGTWKVLDFGVARAMGGGDTLTGGQVVGTPAYMAPEQAVGGAIDHATDLYALAAVAYRALTGTPPFVAGEIAETLYKVVHGKPRRPSQLADVPPEVDLVLAIGMAKDRDRRFASAAELAAALRAAFAGALPADVFERGRQLERAGAWA
jgi:eukaryotic-like serine/threonine-protein kinase